jgi:hypothetical protein
MRMKNALLVSLLALGALGLTACGGGDDDQTAAASETTAASEPTPAGVSPTKDPPVRARRARVRAERDWGWVEPGARHALTEEGVPFSFRMPTRAGGWERFSSISTDKSAGGPISINKSRTGPQGAEAIIFWTSFPDGDYADPCARLLSSPAGSSAADLAAAVSTAPGTELVTGPSNVTLGGRPATRVELTVRENVGCKPGFYYTWKEVNGGALWQTTGVGATIRVWIVDVDGTRLFIEAETTKQAGGDLEQEVQQIVESIRFE